MRAKLQVLRRRRHIRWHQIGRGLQMAVVIGFAATFLWMMSRIRIIPVAVEKGNSIWTQLPWTAIVALVAALTFWIGNKQRDAHFEYECLQRDVTDTLNRLEGDSVSLRAHAASRLGAIAKRSVKVHFGGVRQPYPVFEQASASLTTALHLEREPPVRAAVVKAIRGLVDWCGEGHQAMLLPLIQDLADANRTARQAATEAIAELCAARMAAQPQYDHRQAAPTVIQLLADISPFQLGADCARQCVEDLALASECEAVALRLHRRYHLNPPSGELDLACVHDSCAVLEDTRGALGLALEAYALDSKRYRPISKERQLDLSGCFLPGLECAGIDLSGGKLFGCMLQYGRMQRANLTDADLSNTWMSHIDLCRSDLADANLNDARLPASYLSWSNLEGAFMPRADLRNALLDNTNLQRANLERARLDNAVLTLADLRKGMLMGASLRDALAEEVNLAGAQLTCARLIGARLTEANLSAASILGTHFEEADLSGANLAGAKRWGSPHRDELGRPMFICSFAGATLSGTSFEGADLRHADLQHARGLTPGQLLTAITDDTTTM